jgi:hypothetical protein
MRELMTETTLSQTTLKFELLEYSKRVGFKLTSFNEPGGMAI